LKVLILGCGYVGQALASAWRTAGHAITGWVRSESSAAALLELGIKPWVGDLSAEEDWQGLPPDFDFFVHCASSSRGGAEAYARVYVRGIALAQHYLPRTQGLFVSSTSVYGQTEGEIVTETSPAEPMNETSQLLREAEAIAWASQTIVLRVAGIYGPERGALLKKFLAQEAMIEGDGTRWMNQVHRTDVVQAIQHVATLSTPEKLYNVADNEPVTYRDFYQWLATETHLPLPPHGPVNANRKRGLTNKRVSNGLLTQSGWHPLYPTFREGLRHELTPSGLA
jgi:nucleoside-diphosphate-sugar epimerase